MLVLQVAAQILPRFPDGAWLCELQAVRDPAGVLDTVATVFAVRARQGLSLEESLLNYLRDQKVLIVLDNCEHLLRPVASLLARIQAAGPEIWVLATSREGLNLRGEQIVSVPSLGVPEEGLERDAVVKCDSLRLFFDRACAVKSNFTLENANVDEWPKSVAASTESRSPSNWRPPWSEL